MKKQSKSLMKLKIRKKRKLSQEICKAEQAQNHQPDPSPKAIT